VIWLLPGLQAQPDHNLRSQLPPLLPPPAGLVSCASARKALEDQGGSAKLMAVQRRLHRRSQR
jgi:hypothetical protein